MENRARTWSHVERETAAGDIRLVPLHRDPDGLIS
jgi:hypothetical protein